MLRDARVDSAQVGRVESSVGWLVATVKFVWSLHKDVCLENI